MADLLGGDTIHHACGIPVMQKHGGEAAHQQRHMDITKKVLQWRWLIIDEISMVSARLFAQIDVKVRNVICEVGTPKVGADRRDRPFGGLNVLCGGDLWQLDPPDGGFLGDIPAEAIRRARQYVPGPTVSHGQSLMWGGGEHGIQGVTELEERLRGTFEARNTMIHMCNTSASRIPTAGPQGSLFAVRGLVHVSVFQESKVF